MLATSDSSKLLKATEPHRVSQEDAILQSQGSGVGPSEFHADVEINGSLAAHKINHVEKQARKTEVLCGECAAPSTGSGHLPTGLIIALAAIVQFKNKGPEMIGDESKGHQDGAAVPMFHGDGIHLVGSKVKKKLGDQILMGAVVYFDLENNRYKVEYEDGDEEDLEWIELKPIMLHSNEVKSTKRKKRHSFFTPRKRRRFKQSGKSLNSEGRRAKGMNRGHLNPEADQSFQKNEKSKETEKNTGGRSLPFPRFEDNLSSPAMAAKKRSAELRFKMKSGKEVTDTSGMRQAACLEGSKAASKGLSGEHLNADADRSFQKNEISDGKEKITGGQSPPFSGIEDNLSTPAMAAKKRSAELLLKTTSAKEVTDTAGMRQVACLEGSKAASKGMSREYSTTDADLSFQKKEISDKKEKITSGRSPPFPGIEENLSTPAMDEKKSSAELLLKMTSAKEVTDTAGMRQAACLEGNNEALRDKMDHSSNSTESASSLSDRKRIIDAKPAGEGMRIVGRKIRKDLGGQLFDGFIIDYDQETTYCKVQYEDGDVEELEWSEVEASLLPHSQKCLSFKYLLRARRLSGMSKQSCEIIEDSSHHVESMLDSFSYNGKANLNGMQEPIRYVQDSDQWSLVKEVAVEPTQASIYFAQDAASHHLSLSASCFSSARDTDGFEYFCWGEVSGFNKAKRPELQATKLLPTSSPIRHLAVSHHHLAAVTTSGQVWLWRNRHGNIHSRCNEWEHIACLDGERVVLADISGPDVDRASSGYEPDQEDQVSDPFYLVAVTASGEDFILHGSQPQELVRTYHFNEKPAYHSLSVYLSQNNMQIEDIGQVVQISVGTVEASDESPFVGYITDTGRVYIRSSTNGYTEEINLITGFTGRPTKIQCGRTYHAIIMTDDGHAWTWGCRHYPGIELRACPNFPAMSCQSAVGTLAGHKVIDVGCYGEDFVALTSDGEVHQWTHGVPRPSSGVYNVPASPLAGWGPCVAYGDKLVKISIGVGMYSGVTESGRVHTWRTAMKGGFMGMPMLMKEALTPLGREESVTDTLVRSLGNWVATHVISVAGSLIVVVRKKSRA